MRYRKLACPDSPVSGVYLNVGNDGYDRVATLSVGEPPSVEHIGMPGVLAVRRLASLCPVGPPSGGSHDSRIPGRADVLQPERDGVRSCRGRDLVDELLAPKVHLGSQRIPQVRGPQR